ncbi:MAG TPA: methionine--tRNA ligase subunit beta [Thermodesulfovibrionia bacterium]|nr:methionine--tRNA ligase subunit beta [Thermodesulfovibrionia bacterium]
MITFEDFKKLEIKIGRILSAKRVEGTDKLIELLVDIGTEERTLVAGIAQSYSAEELPGKLIPVLVNLEPKKMRGITSHGMILAATEMEGKPVLLHPDRDVLPGSEVR